jgi:hypothetical protein
MSDDPFRGAPGTNPPRYPRKFSTGKATGLVLGAIAIAVIVAVALLAGSPSSSQRASTVNPPAATVLPAPARAPVTSPTTTTGQAIPLDRGNDSIGTQEPASPR